MAVATTTLLAASLALTAVGAGVSAYGQYQQGQTQNAIAQFNAKQREKDTALQLQSMQVQAALQKQQAEANFALRSAEANARFSNADAMERNALAQDAVNRVNLRKRQEEFARMQSTQRATIAASGIIETAGTPLDLLAETAGAIQRDAEEQHYVGEVQRRTIFSEAANERLGGKLALAGATLDLKSGLAEASLREAAARGAAASGRAEANIIRMTGGAAAKAGTIGAVGTIFSGLNSAADTTFRYRAS